MGKYEWKPFTLLVTAEEVERSMDKFKVGDTVNWTESRGSWQGVKITRVSQYEGLETEYYVECNDRGIGLIQEKYLELASKESSPIRTVTRREIVAGVYGDIVNVDVCEKNVFVSIRNNPYSQEQLREAAHILNQIAEALEENSK